MFKFSLARCSRVGWIKLGLFRSKICLLESSWGLRGAISSIGAACGNKLCHILPGRENDENKTTMKTCFDFFQEGFLRKRDHGYESTWLRILDGCSFILYPRFDPSFDLNLNLDPLNLAVLFLKSLDHQICCCPHGRNPHFVS